MTKTEKTCFIIMPISDADDYPADHFKRVYEYIIKPACEKAGFIAVRADDVKKTNFIVLDIIQKILNSEMAVCDLSSRNPNVLYELGIRQSFDLPVSLIKDELTTRVFDIQGFRDVEYDSSLRVDEVNTAIEKLAANIIETYESKGDDVNSIVELLGISKAKISKQQEISSDTALILKSLSDISLRLSAIETKSTALIDPELRKNESVSFFEKDGTTYNLHDRVIHSHFGIGEIMHIERNSQGEAITRINFESVGLKFLIVKFANLSKLK